MENQLFVQIDEEKKRKFKTKVAGKGHKIKDVINAAVDDYLSSDGKPKWFKG